MPTTATRFGVAGNSSGGGTPVVVELTVIVFLVSLFPQFSLVILLLSGIDVGV